MPFTFGPFTLDEGRRLLFRDGQPVPLSPKAYLLLVTLVGAQPRVMTKQELMACVWPATHVLEANLTNLVAELRQALGDHAHVIRTAHGVGYAFEGGAVPVQARSPLAWVVTADREWPLVTGTYVLGREAAADIVLGDPSVSRRHARLVVEPGRALLEDLGSKNGTFVNGKPLGGPLPLHDGDQVRMGLLVVGFRAGHFGEETRTITVPPPGGSAPDAPEIRSGVTVRADTKETQ